VNEEDLTALLGQHASRDSVPGATVGILRNGVVTTAYYGVADVTTSEPVTPDTVFSVGSLTKSMVAHVVARLAESGRLSLDDRVDTTVHELRTSGWAGTSKRA
jgi:CubicO group peptidase (beta-lactamase class C family)